VAPGGSVAAEPGAAGMDGVAAVAPAGFAATPAPRPIELVMSAVGIWMEAMVSGLIPGIVASARGAGEAGSWDAAPRPAAELRSGRGTCGVTDAVVALADVAVGDGCAWTVAVPVARGAGGTVAAMGAKVGC